MSDAQSSWGPGARVRPAVAVAVVAALVALGLGGQGLLVPAGPVHALARVLGAVASLAAVGVLLRIDGPALAARTLVVVAVAGALTGLATLPHSPVVLSEPSVTAPATPAVPGNGPDVHPGSGDVHLDRASPPETPPTGTLVLPEGASAHLDGNDVVVALPDGTTAVLGRATSGAGAPTPVAPADGEHPGVAVVDGLVTRSDGGPIGGATPLGGVVLEGTGTGTHVVVGDGVLLEVPRPIPVEPSDPPGPLTESADALLAVLLACFALLAFAPPIVRVTDRVAASRADPEPPPATPSGPAGAGPVEDGLADVLRSMLADPDPRTAVIGAYARLLSALAESGHGRRAEETPHEHLWRTLGPLGVRRAPVHQLAELFVRARFTPRPVTPEHRRAAIAALADAVADLRLSARDVDEVAESVGARR